MADIEMLSRLLYGHPSLQLPASLLGTVPQLLKAVRKARLPPTAKTLRHKLHLQTMPQTVHRFRGRNQRKVGRENESGGPLSGSQTRLQILQGPSCAKPWPMLCCLRSRMTLRVRAATGVAISAFGPPCMK